MALVLLGDSVFNCGAKALFCLAPGTCGIKNTISGLIITNDECMSNSGGVFLGGVFYSIKTFFFILLKRKNAIMQLLL